MKTIKMLRHLVKNSCVKFQFIQFSLEIEQDGLSHKNKLRCFYLHKKNGANETLDIPGKNKIKYNKFHSHTPLSSSALLARG